MAKNVEIKKEVDRSSIAENKTKEHVKRIERNLADFFKSALQKQLVQKQRVDTGATLQSIKRIKTEDGFAVSFSHIIKILDEGRGSTNAGGPGSVRKAMEKMIRRKNIDVSWASGKTKDQRIKSAAFAFAAKIHKKGFKATPMIKPAMIDLETNKLRIIKNS